MIKFNIFFGQRTVREKKKKKESFWNIETFSVENSFQCIIIKTDSDHALEQFHWKWSRWKSKKFVWNLNFKNYSHIIKGQTLNNFFHKKYSPKTYLSYTSEYNQAKFGIAETGLIWNR